MLELKKIKKNYNNLDGEVTRALNGVDIKFRKCEFVSILGPSGCGKTTLLNIVGGLDKYSSGDLIINGVSTKNYTDRDWDSYRNHKIGFIFQSYNLIPHLNVLENVELALTLSGVSGEERKQKAKTALEKVGLGDKLKSRPNQLSGGQMQRVAIARALVNDPQIILADEPTGALDSKTSVQIMDLLKEISGEKLIIMVTHNPELAQTYSTRIISLLDGKVVDDTNVFDGEDEALDVSLDKKVKEEIITKKDKKKAKKQRTKMSFWTAISLSFKNLLTKKARTLLVSFAGSIGIIGIALILSLSNGFQAYINKTQEDTLSSYPISINRSNTDMMSLMLSMFSEKTKQEHDSNAVYGSDTMSDIFDKASSSLKANDLDAFKAYIEENQEEINKYVSGIKYTYEISLDQGSSSSLINMGTERSELVYVFRDNQQITPKTSTLMDMIVLYAMIYLKHEVWVDAEESAGNFVLRTTPDLFPKDENTNPKYRKAYNFLKLYLTETQTNELFVGDQTTITLNDFITIISKAMGIPIELLYSYKSYDLSLFNEMLDNQTLIESQYELLGSSRWPQNKNEIMLVLGDDNEVRDYILYALGLINEETMKAHMQSLFTETPTILKVNYDNIIGKKYKMLMKSDFCIIKDGKYHNIQDLLKDGEITPLEYATYYADIMEHTSGRELTICGVLRLKENTTSGVLSSGLCYTKELTSDMLNTYNSSAPVVAGDLLKASTTPTSINFYAQTFEAKSGIENFIKAYNDKQTDEDKKIEYSDYIGLLMSSISTIISAISYVLIAFVSVSLVVSSIMIGIITYISVLERTKEIGVLRSIGASKKDIKRVFISESAIIGLVAGLIGILLTLILNIPINLIIKSLAGLVGVASLPIFGALGLIAISVVLTLIAGLVPARIASKKDPVIALRTE